jgi:hypothetical protein
MGPLPESRLQSHQPEFSNVVSNGTFFQNHLSSKGEALWRYFYVPQLSCSVSKRHPLDGFRFLYNGIHLVRRSTSPSQRDVRCHPIRQCQTIDACKRCSVRPATPHSQSNTCPWYRVAVRRVTVGRQRQ